jgi:5'-nucleotidase/UDP-sugar diphosphatase
MRLPFILLAAILSAAVGPASSFAKDFKLSILHINDVHSRIEPINKFNSTCRPTNNVAGECFGGMARVKTAIEARRSALEAAGRHVLTLDAGDQFQGSLFYSTYKGMVAVELMNQIGFDAMAVGNHEFDNGPENLAKFADRANFPLLFANTNISNEPILAGKIKSHIIKSFGRERVAIIGILAEDTDETSSPGENVSFIQSETVLKKLIAKLEADGVNKIILLSHVGLPRDKQIAAAVNGIDVIVGGHSHSLLKIYPTVVKAPNGQAVPIVQAYAYSKYLGELTVTFDAQGHVSKAKGRVWELNAVVREDSAFAAFIAQKAAPIEELKRKVIGNSRALINGDRKTCRAKECSMGNLVADAMLARSEKQGISIAILNSGSLRASIDTGAITMGEVVTVLPFQNTLSTFQLKGSDIIAALENGVSQVETGAGRFPQVAGLRFTFDSKNEVGQRVSDVLVRGPDGKYSPIDPEQIYGVATNDYLRSGGDGYKLFKTRGLKTYDFGPGLDEVVAHYIASLGGTYRPYVDGRITVR